MHPTPFKTACLFTVAFSLLAAAPAEPTTRPDLPTLWLIGDSTVKVGTPGQRGWGEEISQFFNTDKINVINRAIGGRSSRTFRTEGRWDDVLNGAKPGDYVLMQFGHNDASALAGDNRERGSIRGTGDETQHVTLTLGANKGKEENVHSYGWYMRQYVKEAKAKGMHPIVLSYIPRCPRPGSATQPAEPVKVPAELTSYALWAQQVAREENVPFLDLFRLVLKTYAGRDPAEINKEFFSPGEYTHTNKVGAKHNAECVVEGIKSLEGEGSDLKQYLK